MCFGRRHTICPCCGTTIASGDNGNSEDLSGSFAQLEIPSNANAENQDNRIPEGDANGSEDTGGDTEERDAQDDAIELRLKRSPLADNTNNATTKRRKEDVGNERNSGDGDEDDQDSQLGDAIRRFGGEGDDSSPPTWSFLDVLREETILGKSPTLGLMTNGALQNVASLQTMAALQTMKHYAGEFPPRIQAILAKEYYESQWDDVIAKAKGLLYPPISFGIRSEDGWPQLEGGWQGLDDTLETEHQVETLIRFFPQFLQPVDHTMPDAGNIKLLPIHFLFAHSKAVSFVPLFFQKYKEILTPAEYDMHKKRIIKFLFTNTYCRIHGLFGVGLLPSDLSKKSFDVLSGLRNERFILQGNDYVEISMQIFFAIDYWLYIDEDSPSFPWLNDGNVLALEDFFKSRLRLLVEWHPSLFQEDPDPDDVNSESPNDFPRMPPCDNAVVGFSDWRGNVEIPKNYFSCFPPTTADAFNSVFPTQDEAPQFEQMPLFKGPKKDRVVPIMEDLHVRMLNFFLHPEALSIPEASFWKKKIGGTMLNDLVLATATHDNISMDALYILIRDDPMNLLMNSSGTTNDS